MCDYSTAIQWDSWLSENLNYLFLYCYQSALALQNSLLSKSNSSHIIRKQSWFIFNSSLKSSGTSKARDRMLDNRSTSFEMTLQTSFSSFFRSQYLCSFHRPLANYLSPEAVSHRLPCGKFLTTVIRSGYRIMSCSFRGRITTKDVKVDMSITRI